MASEDFANVRWVWGLFVGRARNVAHARSVGWQLSLGVCSPEDSQHADETESELLRRQSSARVRVLGVVAVVAVVAVESDWSVADWLPRY